MKKLLESSPIIIEVLIILNIILIQLGIQYMHYLFLGACVLIFIINFASKRSVILSASDSLFLVFFSLVTFLILMNLVLKISSVELVLNSSVFILLTPLYWFLYFKLYRVDMHRFLKLIVYVSFVNALVTACQLFINPNLFGLYSYSDFRLENLSFRPGALFGSPQINGLFLILGSLVAFEIYILDKNRWFLILAIFILPLAISTGNKSVLLTLILYATLKIFLIKNNKAIRSLFLIGLLLIPILFFLGNFKTSNKYLQQNVERITKVFTNSEEFSKGEAGGRLKIYNDFFQDFVDVPIYFVTGQGAGFYSSIARSEDDNKRKTESFLLLILGEYGIMVLASFLLIVAKSIRRAYRYRFDFNYFIILSVLAISFVYVHAFAHPAFFIFWAVILAPIYHSRTIGEKVV